MENDKLVTYSLQLLFDSRWSNSTTIHQIYYSDLTRLRSGHLVFALTTNLESGPRFADICCLALTEYFFRDV